MRHEGALVVAPSRLRLQLPFLTLALLLVCVFALGGGARDDIVSLIVLRPVAAIALGIGLFTLTREHWQAYRLALGMMAAIMGLIILHLIPLPPAIWMAVPGRELAIAAGEASGGGQPWRPLSLVPYRGWNAFYAMIVPAAAMVLAVQLGRDDHRRIVGLVIAAGMASALWGIIQSVGGFSRSLYFYNVTNYDYVTGLFANRNHMAAMQIALVPFLTVFASRANGPRKGVIQIACAALAGLALMMALATGSRAAIVFSIAAIGASWLVWRARPNRPIVARRGGNKQAWVPYAVAGFGAIMLAGFSILLFQSQGFSRLQATGSVEEFRFVVWDTVAGILPAYLPVGSGVGSFVEVFKVHEPSEMLGTNYWNHAHNDWLEWALEGGLPAIALMLASIAGWAYCCLSLLRQSHTGRLQVQLGLAAGIVLFVLGLWSGVDYPLRVPALSAVAALCAVWLAMPRDAETLQSGSGQTLDSEPQMKKAAKFKMRPVKRTTKGSDQA